MKILELRLKNLNSLYGEWIIDFTNPEYVSNGIFALTGPTGAGKSTILDAICLALYGATPRLGRITKSGNEIMSRQTGDCYAEVLFKSQFGHFRCHWEQRRARKQRDGSLQFPEHQIADSDTGKLIETKRSLVSRVIEQKTGMDFDRFTRSILLAQGGFDTFLKADVEQKSKILEQITGTEIYSEISRRVHERQRDEREKLNLLQAETTGIVILEPEQEQEVQLDLKAKQKEEAALAAQSAETAKALTWLAVIEGLKKDISSLSEEAVRLQADINSFKPERDKLDRAIKAAALDGSYATLTTLRKLQTDDQAALKSAAQALPERETTVKNQAEALTSAELKTISARKELKTSAPLIQEVRALDQRLVELNKSVSAEDERCTNDANKIEADTQTRQKVREKRTEARRERERADNYLRTHVRDEWLVSGLTGIEEQLGRMLSRQKEISQKEAERTKVETALEHASKKLDDCRKRCGTQKRELENASKKLQQGKDSLSQLLGDRLLREYRTEKETLLRETAFLSKITELEDLRTTLVDGTPCPLCGAPEHPFAQGNVPMPDETEKKIAVLSKLITAAEYQESAITKIEIAERNAGKKLIEREKLEATAANDKKAAEKVVALLRDSLENILTEYNELTRVVFAKLQPLDITEIPGDDVSSLLESLQKRLNAWRAHINKKVEIEKHLTDLDGEMKRLNAVIETQGAALLEKRENLNILKKEHVAGSDKRKKLYGSTSPDNEESRLNKAIAAAEAQEKKSRALHTELQQQLNAAQTHVDSLKKYIDQRDPELKNAEANFTTALAPAGFSDVKQFFDAILSPEQRDRLSARAKELDNRHTELTARQKDRETRLAAEIAKKVTDKPVEELEPQFKAYEGALKQLRDIIAGLNHKLNENTAAKERVKEKQTAIEAQKKAYHRWEKLHGLIGSADGKKYRNYAQGLTFELMVSHANCQLEKMSDRYLLIRDEEQPLELNVVDNFQAGEIRSTKNLSGGESFIVSLTLALGLSKMASRKVRVDSLFLDEGFGTLDEDALETALETLSGLQQNDKLIGIISHVSALKERISTQITITPKSGGRSILSGPGCSMVEKRIRVT